jgi:hypothetical protein
VSALSGAAILILASPPGRAQQDVITTAIGGGPDNIPAVNSDIHLPYAIVADPAGNYYFTAVSSYRVFKVDVNGILTVVAGNGIAGETGDGVSGGAVNAELNGPAGLALDAMGNLYVADYNGCAVRKVDKTNTITTVAGTPGSCGFGGDNGPGTSAKLNLPRALTLDGAGNLYIADYENCRVRRLALATDTITTFAGSGTCSYSGDGGSPTSAGIAYPLAVAADNAGDVIISDLNSYRIREVNASDSIISTVAGTGSSGSGCPAGAASSTAVGQTYGMTVDSGGTTVTFADFTHDCIRQFAIGGAMSTIAGKSTQGFCGDGGPATSACFYGPTDVAANSSATYYVADYNNDRIRAFTIGGDISTVAGNGSTTFPTLISGEPAQGVVLNEPVDVLEDPSGNVFIAEYGNCTVREFVKSTGLVNIFAGSAAANAVTGTCGFSGAGGPATSAELGSVEGLARDSAGNIYIADGSNCIVWQVSASTGDISVFAGIAKSCGYSGDNVPATDAKLDVPAGLAVDSLNNLYIADYTNNRIRVVTAGVINTFAGNGTPGYAGDGDPATSAELQGPSAVSIDGGGNLYIADDANCVVREVVAATSLIETIAGNHVCGFDGDGLATEHELNHPTRLHSDANGNVFVSDQTNQLLRWISPEGVLTTFGGDRTQGLSGDGALATSAELNDPDGITLDASGNYLIADYNNSRVRQISAFAALNMSASNLSFGLVPVGNASSPQVITLSALGQLTFSSISVSGPFAEADNCGTGLSSGATCSVYLVFQPTATGTVTGAITIEDSGFFTTSSTINLEGEGTGISVTGGPLAFGNQAVKTTSAAKTVTVTNKGTAPITFGAVSVTDADFVVASNKCPASGSTLAAGAKCTISVVFRPKTTGVKKGALAIDDSDPSSPQVVGLSGTGTSQVVLTPGSIAFPTQAVNSVSSLTQVTLTNSTGASITLGNPALSITGPFEIGTGATFCTNGLVIPSNGTCFIYVKFAPTVTGYPTGTLTVSDNSSSSPQAVALSGTATGISFNPAEVIVSSPIGKQASTPVAITNVGTSTISFTAQVITGPNKQDFTTTNLTDPPCGGSLAAGASCNFTVNFTPSVAGSESATLLIYDNSPGSPQMLTLQGTGQ